MEVSAYPRRRLWLVFFSNGDGPAWWTGMFREGFRHVSAAAYYSDEDRWVYFNPAGKELTVEIARPDDFEPRFVHLISTSSAILRIASQSGRRRMPAVFYCVGAVKALLGVHSSALCPRGLHRDLLAQGAEEIEIPHVVTIQRERAATAGAGSGIGCGPGDYGSPAATAAAGRGRSDQDAAAAAPRRDGTAELRELRRAVAADRNGR